MKIKCSKCQIIKELKTYNYEMLPTLKTSHNYIYCECIYSSYKLSINEYNEITHYRIMIDDSWIAASKINNKTHISNSCLNTLNTYDNFYALENNDISLEIQAVKIFDRLIKLNIFN